MFIKEVLKQPEMFSGQQVKFKGWVSNVRGNTKVKFIEINDGSTVLNLQCVLKNDNYDLAIVDNLGIGSSVEITGLFVSTPDKQQKAEVSVEKIEILSLVKLDEYPIQNKEISVEVLRQMPHLRHRTRLFKSIMILRSALFFEINNFFQSEGFINFSAPILTSNDGEGAGETFIVDDEKGGFFNKKTTLGVTGQLHAESYALGFQKVYTFAPTFRAEKSNTKKHAAEFWMVEPEVAFFNLNDIIDLGEKMLKTSIVNVISKHNSEFDFLEKYTGINLRKRLIDFTKNQIEKVNYEDALKILREHKDQFENQDLDFGADLKTEHERFLAEQVFKAPVAITNYPKDIKAFYMHQNDDGRTVAAFDLLVPGIGELIGGSQREVRYEKLEQRINELGMNQEDLQWYLDLRKFGNAGSAGFGLGFERLVMYVTGIDNIRDVIPYPRTNKTVLM
ncbi:asparagine--tRNA ligase [Mesomycoplasma bovoculi]|uniref:Asparagine--tRNA ligase n=1 Tax=Mesomycoplasma bovoculi M165/69 TaxID=743966 RepID=W5UTL4_9BACT|nr:asparagine--tRNA ligase [Mesomycoplasma bovoculi]AHH45165.1 asparaginyl-tRNA synthetase [Mesomycoplasma bovoculi M165/69]